MLCKENDEFLELIRNFARYLKKKTKLKASFPVSPSSSTGSIRPSFDLSPCTISCSELPEGLWWRIFQHLEAKELLQCMAVCTQWCHLARCSQLWEALTWKDWSMWAQQVRVQGVGLEDSQEEEASKDNSARLEDEEATGTRGPVEVVVNWRQEYAAIANGERTIDAEVVNKLLTFGTFGSAFLCKLKVHPKSGAYLVQYHPTGDKQKYESELVLPGRVRSVPSSDGRGDPLLAGPSTPAPDAVTPTSSRITGRRRAEDEEDEDEEVRSSVVGTAGWTEEQSQGRVKQLESREGDEVSALRSQILPMNKSEFNSLQPGTPVEVQWKGSDRSPHFNWWFAQIHSVHPMQDEVTLMFEQYDSQHPDHSKLKRLVTIHREDGGPLHGGVAGGIRKCTQQDLHFWQASLIFGSELAYKFERSSRKWVPSRVSARMMHAQHTMQESSFAKSTYSTLQPIDSNKATTSNNSNHSLRVPSTANSMFCFPLLALPSNARAAVCKEQFKQETYRVGKTVFRKTVLTEQQ